jgi:hypothetical protein
MPTARSRLADIEGAGLGTSLTASEIGISADCFRAAARDLLAQFLREVECDARQCEEANDATSDWLHDLIADATARQLREIEENDG